MVESGILCESRNSMVPDGGVSSKALPKSASRGGGYAMPKCTGMKQGIGRKKVKIKRLLD